MQVKKFEAPTLQEALDTIKRELGPEAVILQTRQNKKGFGLLSKASIEVTAAVSDKALTKKSSVETRLPKATQEVLRRLPAERQSKVYDHYVEQASRQTSERVQLSSRPSGASAAGPARSLPQRNGTAPLERGPSPAPRVTEQRYIDIPDEDFKQELRSLKRLVEDLKEGGGAGGAPPELGSQVLQEALDQLLHQGVERRIALPLLKRVAFELGEASNRDREQVLDQVAQELLEAVQVARLLPGGRKAEGAAPEIVALVGPTGVGKTTTLAKLASLAKLHGSLNVGLINLDSYKVAAYDQLAAYAKILQVPFRSVGTALDLRSAIADFQSMDVILVDTTGRSQKDPQALAQMAEVLAAAPRPRVALVLSATTRDAELVEATQRFSVFKPVGLIFSKVDEASIYGCILNVSQRSKTPLLHFTTGQRVPEDIEPATPERVASLILGL